jgi:hypothetical protein
MSGNDVANYQPWKLVRFRVMDVGEASEPFR